MTVVQPVLRRKLGTVLACAAILGGLASLPAQPRVDARPAASGPWLDRLNTWRSSTGLSSLSENATWSAGDYAHSQYMVMNDLVTHYETQGTPYYSTAGDTAAQDGNIFVSSTTSTTDAQAIDWWMGAPFHAMGLMDPRLTATGFGSYRYVKSGWQMGATVDTIRGNTFTGGAYPVFFPGNGSTEPLTSYSGNEFPDPLQACSGYAMPTGLPVFIQVGGNVSTTATASSFTANGTALAHCVIDSNNASVGSYLKPRGGVILIPRSPLQNGVTYTVGLTVNGTPYTWSFKVGPFPPHCSGVDVTSDLNSPQKLGGTITFNATAGGCANPLYEFWIQAPGSSLYTLAQAYSTTATFAWKTSGLSAGTYRINVWVRDASSAGTFSNSSGAWDAYNASLYFMLTPGCPSVTTSASPAGGVMVGNPVTITASASGCPNPLYEFWILAPGASLYTLAQPYGSAATLAWSTVGLVPGTYRINVWVKDAASAGVYSNASGTWDAYDASRYYTVSAGCPTVLDSASPAPAMDGTKVTITATAPGCGNPQFELWVLAPGSSSYTLVQPYTASTSLAWNTTGLAPGVYRVNVWVRSATSAGLYSNASGSWDSYNANLYFTVTAGCPSVSVSASPASAAAGTTITLTASAPGCPNPQYEFWILAPGASLYTLARPYGSGAVLTWTTTGDAAGSYRIDVWVRDAASAGLQSNAYGTWDAYNASLYVPLT